MKHAELLGVETSVLRTLCLTANSEGSTQRSCILAEVAEDDFYFPITRSIYATVFEMTQDGTNVDVASLQQALARRSVNLPDDFFVEDLFAGEAPTMETLAGWIADLKGEELSVAAQDSEHPVPSPRLAETHPSVRSDAPGPSEIEEPAQTEASLPQEPSEEAPSPLETPQPSRPPEEEILYPESGEWLRYLADLTKKQGEHLKTGFEGVDGEEGGLVGGADEGRVLDFLKQLVDQIAIRCRVPCLYLSFERSKAELRLQTLSRLSGAGAEQIRAGKFNKDSKAWQDIVRTGEQAVEWLQRIYVVESTPGLAVTRMRELRQNLIGSGAGASCLIAVDNLDKLSNESDLLQSVAELKELAESLGIVVIGRATSPVELVHERSADMAAIFTETDGTVGLEVRTPGNSTPRVLQFDYQPATHRFVEITPVVS
jgi:replicative DNA helicase